MRRMQPFSDQDLRIIFFFVKLLGLIVTGTCLFFLAIKIKNSLFSNSPTPPDTHSSINLSSYKGKTGIGIALSAIVVYFLVASVSYFSWIQGDEWLLMRRYTLPITERILLAIDCYFNWVARLPEIIGTMGLHRNCWQDWLITPLFVITAPFAILRLCNRLSGVSQPMSVRFYLFLLACLLFCTAGNYTAYWVNVTYFWTSVPIIFFVSLFWDKENECKTKWKIIAAALLGIYCGWATETTAQLLIIILSARMAWLCIKKTPPSSMQIGAYIGCLIGAYMLLSSPAMVSRQAQTASPLVIMSSDYIWDYVHNLSWEKVRALGVNACVANLKGIPLLWRYNFIPYCLLLFWDMAFVPACIFIILALFTIFRKNWHALSVGLIIIVLSIESALAYLAGAIPSTGGFTPPTMMVMCAAAYLFHQMKYTKWLKNILCSLLVFLAIAIYVPDIVIAAQYKHIDNALDSDIAKLSAQGNKHIILEKAPIPDFPSPTYNIPSSRRSLIHSPLRSMIYSNNLRTDENNWINKSATRYFQTKYPIESIKRKE